MVNVNKLKGKIIENGLNIPELANKIGMDKATLYRKINNSGKFTIKEADCISKELDLSLEEVNAIFFSQYVA
jgi:plasmid maintenance system antidote protein VapI